jgi:predicted Zn-dependent protease
MGDLDTALAESRRTAALDPDSPKASELLGMVLYRQGQLAEALSVLEPVADREDGRPETLYTLALAYQGLERFEEARDALRTVVDRQPEHAEAWFNLGKVLAVLGDEAGAEEANAVFMRLSGQPGAAPPADDANLPPGVGPS